MLGRMSPGCEGTHGMFPSCNFRCSPCYHSADANRVRTDGAHTITEVARQMELLAEERGASAHCQLIGGEVSLLDAEDHARALEVMRFYGRLPMSFSHGDFDYEYLKRLAVHPDGTARFARIDFAAHFDMFMYGRRGIPKPDNEEALNPYRRAFVDMFARLRREHGVQYYIAHNMTVQRGNLHMIADVVREVLPYGFRMMSFQPAAAQGALQRRVASLREDDTDVENDNDDALWEEIERGAGTRLPYQLFQMGHRRCNRMSICAIVGDRVVPLFDDRCERDARFRDVIMTQFGNIALPSSVLAIKMLRVALFRPWLLLPFFLWLARMAKRCGPFRILRYRLRFITFVMHRFMDADVVNKAWALMQDGHNENSDSVLKAGPRIKDTVERLSSCSYGMAQVGMRLVVPACVQHSVYDEAENLQLSKVLSLRDNEATGSSGGQVVERPAP